MEYLKITDSLKREIEPKLETAFPDRDYYIRATHWHDGRYIRLKTVLDDDDIYYMYYQGRVELCLDGKFSDYNYKYNSIRRNLVEESRSHEELSWHKWGRRKQGRCQINLPIESAEDIVECFKRMSRIFDPVLSPFAEDGNADMIMRQMESSESFPPADSMKVEELTYKILKIKDLPFKDFVIPEYQRPYKWGIKNVNQLINDLLHFKDSEEYRLGTLVLHDNDIVDGQQRIITLSLLLHELFNKEGIREKGLHREVQGRIRIFWERTEFKNGHSIGHVRENLSSIKDRLDDLDESFLDFLLDKCKFVVVRLREISEAFQFFDSQNARGKDLEPHDLLKAFHLREIKSLSERDSKNITAWQDLGTRRLVDLFLSLYRIKRWAKNNGGKEFTKDDIDAFKGISLDDRRYPFYMQQVICHFFSTFYATELSRQIDRSELEFPFQIDHVCINGSRFFDMVRHYDGLYNRITDEKAYEGYDSDEDEKSAYKIVRKLNGYPNRTRTGDVYVRQLFDCLLMYYVDRFGFEEINKVVKKIFRYAYKIRLMHFSVQLQTVNNSAVDGIMFKTIRDAQSPYDIINLATPQVETFARNADPEIKRLFF